MREQIPNMRQLGPDDRRTLDLRTLLAMCLLEDTNATESDVKEAVAIFEDLDRRMQRLLGNSHPVAKENRRLLEISRLRLANFKPK